MVSRGFVIRVGKYIGIGLVGLVVIIGGLVVAGVLGVPDGGLEDNSWGEVDNESVEVLTTVYVDNPNPFGIGGDADVDYEIDLQEVRIAEGSGDELSVSSGYNELEFATDLLYPNLPEWWASHLQNDEQSELSVDATVETSVGPFSGSPSVSHEDEIETEIEHALDESFSEEFEGEHSGTAYATDQLGVEFPTLDPEPSVDVEEVTVSWGEITTERTEVVMNATIHNPNPHHIPTPGFAGSVEMNDVTVANWSANDVRVLDEGGDQLTLGGEKALIDPGETELRTFVVDVDNEHVARWFPTHVDDQQPVDQPGAEFTNVEFSGQLAMEVGGSDLTIPAQDQAFACQYELETGIFVDQEDSMDRKEECGVVSVATSGLEEAGAILTAEELDTLSNDNTTVDSLLP